MGALNETTKKQHPTGRLHLTRGQFQLPRKLQPAKLRDAPGRWGVRGRWVRQTAVVGSQKRVTRCSRDL